jgi:hypothetical protein
LIAPTNSSATSAALSCSRWRTAAGRSMVRAIEAAVSASMFTFTTYCSTMTS